MAHKSTSEASEADKAIIKRLDTIIEVLLESMPADEKKMSVLRRVELLDDLGYRPVEIARILGKTTVFVGVMLNRLKKQSKKRKKK
jgi:DNA-directed RNA polymerase specialized sigma24 family protein